MSEERRTLIPQFSLRWLMLLTAVMSVVSLVASRAAQGDAWAGGISIGLAAFAVAFLVYGAMFGGVWLFAQVAAGLRSRWRARSQWQSDGAEGAVKSTAKSLLIAFLACTLALHADVASAGSGGTVTLPLPAVPRPGMKPPKPNTTGLSLTVATAWVDGTGYRPVRVTATSTTGPVKSDRVLTVRFRPKQGYTNEDSVAVTQTLEIPQGATTATATLAVPQYEPWGSFYLDVSEGGDYLEHLSINERGAWTSWSGTHKGDSASPVILLLSGVDKLSGDFLMNLSAELIYVTPDASSSGAIDQRILGAASMVGMPAAGSSPPGPIVPAAGLTATLVLGNLPTRWIDYSSFDLMIASLQQLHTLAEKHPQQWSAIKNWLHNGGNLIVYGVGNRWENLAELEKAVGLSIPTSANNADDIDVVKRGWQLPRNSIRNQPLMAGDGIAMATGVTTVVNPDGSVTQVAANPATSVAESMTAPYAASGSAADVVPAERAAFVTRPCGMGLVAAIRSDDQFDGKRFNWTWLYNSIGPKRWQWYQRYGVSLYQTNDDFWNFQIPGVGLAPVLQFQVLITLFVLVIGPLNYYLLRRWGKLNLTVLTVPTGALFITGALMAWAVVADGLGVRVRARSFTHVDQRSGQAECWTRLSYYAGLAPSGGLKFADDTIVIPLELHPVVPAGRQPRALDWERVNPSKVDSPLVQHLIDGWLNSRTATQYITSRIRKTPARLDIKTGAASDPPQVANHLGSPIQWLLIVDPDGKCFTGESIAADATAALKPIDSQQAALQQHLQTLLTDNQPRPPDAMVGTDGSGLFGLDRRRSRRTVPYYAQSTGTYNNVNAGPPTQSTGLLEQSITTLTERLTKNELPPRTYVAIVETSPEVHLGTPAAREEASFHMLVGEW